MASTQAYVSPDGSLRFLVVADDHGDILLGFDGFPWHTHADLLAATADQSEKAVKQFVQDLLGNRLVIAVIRVAGEVRDVRVTDDPACESSYLAEGKSIELRYWDGSKWAGA